MPWFAQGKLIVGATPDDGQIGGAHDPEDAAYIVLCVNAHDAIVGALRELIDDADNSGVTAHFKGRGFDESIEKARAALAKAEGGAA
jgi:hypothetical protein